MILNAPKRPHEYPSNEVPYPNSEEQIEWDLTNGPLSKLLELLDTQVQGSVQ